MRISGLSHEMFQSAPPAEARGDAVFIGSTGDSFKVSIRSPRRSEGRSEDRRRRCLLTGCFNPLPPPKRGEIAPARLLRVVGCGFNPLPPPKRGEIENASDIRYFWESFNPLPPPKRGEIRSLVDSFAGTMTFQSAPPAEARGDSNVVHVNTGPVRSFNPLPPPKRGEIGVPWHTQRHKEYVSIRSPRRSEGRCWFLQPAEKQSFTMLHARIYRIIEEFDAVAVQRTL